MDAVKKTGKYLLKILIGVLAVVLVLVVGLLVFLTVTDYRPAEVEDLTLYGGNPKGSLSAGERVTVTTFNTGYCSLSETEDFFMDGGVKTRPDDKELVRANLRGIQSIIDELDSDLYFLQEADRDSYRSYNIDQFESYVEVSGPLGFSGAYAPNYKCQFVPYPLPPIGKVDCGLVTLSSLTQESAQRLALPSPFKWPMSTANLKRCALVSRVPLESGDAELVLMNIHLEAYESGNGRVAQTNKVLEYAYAEYEKGNYVIIGGDFNQQFPQIPLELVDDSYWVPGSLGSFTLNEGWSFQTDPSVPTCRLLNEPYTEAENPQYYTIDGFIVSPNLTVESVEVKDYSFKYSDHNPVTLTLRLGN